MIPEARLCALERGYKNELLVLNLIAEARWATKARRIFHAIVLGYEEENWQEFLSVCEAHQIDGETLVARDGIVELARAMLTDLPDAPVEEK